MKHLRLLTAGLLLTTGCSLMSRPSEEQTPPPPPPLPLNDPALSATPVGAPPAPPPPPPPELAPAPPNEAFKLPDTMKRTKNTDTGKETAGMSVTLTNSKGETITPSEPKNLVGGESMKPSKKDPSITEIKPAPSLAPLSPPEGAVITDSPMPSSDDNEKLHGASTGPATSHAAVVAGVPPEKALGWLKNGNRRFVRHKLRNDGQSKKDLARLVKDQHPHAMIFSPGDSRIPPEIIFDQKLGEIYVVRANVGVTLDFVRKNVESTVRDLGVNLVVFLNSDGIKEPLLKQSEFLRNRQIDNGLWIVEADYDLANGEVQFRN